MSRGLSLYLDALRFAAAFVVLLSHWAYPRFTEGRWLWIRDLNLGSDAVVVVFVLSGLVVAYAADTKDRAPGRFTFQRLTRLWSVAIPAVLLTLLLDRCGAVFFPTFYDGWWYQPLSVEGYFWHGLSFTSQWGDNPVRLGTNGPWWSLSYEAAFYLLFALWVWTPGARKLVFVGLAAVVIGPTVLLLMPAWLMGVWLWTALRAGSLPNPGQAAALALGMPVFYALALANGLPATLTALTETGLGLPNLRGLGFSDEFVWNALLGALVTAQIWGVAGLVAAAKGPDWPSVRWLAGGSFSLYLVHYPLLQILRPALAPIADSWVGDAVLLAVTVSLSFAFAAVFERTLPVQRRLAQGLLPSRTRAALVPNKAEPRLARP